jgi:hypothetical protein
MVKLLFGAVLGSSDPGQQADDDVDDRQGEHDGELPADWWNGESGRHVTPPMKPASDKEQVAALLRAVSSRTSMVPDARLQWAR